ncbi:MAG TPA: hypothetical protein VL240_07370 [Candidatus Binatia bacterium]|nr:hypothetical protein [Candidatus Binatia bacterium]
MKLSIAFGIPALLFSSWALGQEPAIAPARPLPANPPQKQQNAASATQDSSGTTGDQITKPAGAKASTLIGCLTGPDSDGKYTLRNMNHRTGVQVLGPDDLKIDSGSKVKLTGQWQPSPGPPPQDGSPAEARRFQATDIEVVSTSCHPPSETTPVSRNRRQKPTTYNAPSSDNPK